MTSDDRINSEATLLLDRLVRQGAAFGIHVILSSQTLADQYSIPQTTMGQMGIRIALQSGEADARLILSDDNVAARTLARPGEAIYNNDNGRVEGNSRFQASLLTNEQLEKYTTYIQRLAEERRKKQGWQPPFKQYPVFDGSTEASITDNIALTNLLHAPGWTLAPKAAPQIWPGEPISLKESTTLQLRPQGGHNLLIVGQQDEAALSMLIVALISLAAQYAPGAATFYVANFRPDDAPHATLLSDVAQMLPHRIHLLNRRTLLAAIAEINVEVTERMETDATDRPPIYLLIYGLQRARDLRRNENLGFSFGSEPSDTPDPAQQFAAILREGPDYRIHTLTWCDTLANFYRTCERAMLREFALRLLFQMSSEDSNNLVDSPLASTLGSYRALLFNEETGRQEKFRPYGIPSEEWLKEAIMAINRKS